MRRCVRENLFIINNVIRKKTEKETPIYLNFTEHISFRFRQQQQLEKTVGKIHSKLIKFHYLLRYSSNKKAKKKNIEYISLPLITISAVHIFPQLTTCDEK